jgi:hypothetical protein
MKRSGDIASLFWKHEAKKAAAAASNIAPPLVEEQNQEQDRVVVEDHVPSPVRPQHRHRPHRRHWFMTSIAFHMIQVKGCPLKIILLMIKMQFVEHILLEVLANLIHMIFHQHTLEANLVDSI